MAGIGVCAGEEVAVGVDVVEGFGVGVCFGVALGVVGGAFGSGVA